MNLLNETRENIHRSGHTPDEIIFIGSFESGHQCTWQEFKKLANIEYDSGYGGQEVAKDLRIVFSDGQQMWRGEYDGSEWWEFSQPFNKPKETKRITKLTGGSGWYTLKDLNEKNNNE